MHAKMTRDRKKSFIAAIEKTIEELESSNKRMKAVLEEVISSQKSSMLSTTLVTSSEVKTIVSSPQVVQAPGVTPSSSPAMIPKDTTTWRNPGPVPMPPFPLASGTKRMLHTIVTPREEVHETDDELVEKLPFQARKRVCHGFSLPY